MRHIPIGLQLYTVEAEVHENPKAAIEKVAKIGYKGVEGGADCYGMEPKEYRSLLDRLGLKLITVFTSLDEIEKDLRPKIDLAHQLGAKHIGIPYVDGPRRENADGWKAVAELANKAGALCKRSGLEFIYHNHNFEFTKFDGVYGFDIFYGNTDPTLVKAEIDVFWVQFGGENPAAYIRKYANRVANLHMKDMLGDGTRAFAEVGEGILDWKAILDAASHSKCEWLIVEQDVCRRPPMESAKLSFENLKRMVMG